MLCYDLLKLSINESTGRDAPKSNVDYHDIGLLKRCTPMNKVPLQPPLKGYDGCTAKDAKLVVLASTVLLK